MNEESLTIDCLLHDISYINEFQSEDWLGHGRKSSKIARSFLDTLELSKEFIHNLMIKIVKHINFLEEGVILE